MSDARLRSLLAATEMGSFGRAAFREGEVRQERAAIGLATKGIQNQLGSRLFGAHNRRLKMDALAKPNRRLAKSADAS